MSSLVEMKHELISKAVEPKKGSRERHANASVASLVGAGAGALAGRTGARGEAIIRDAQRKNYPKHINAIKDGNWKKVDEYKAAAKQNKKSLRVARGLKYGGGAAAFGLAG